MKAEQAWQALKGQLQMDLPKATYETWVRPVKFVARENGRFIIGAPNAYIRDWLNERLNTEISRSLTSLLEEDIEVQIVVWQDRTEPVEAPPLVEQPKESKSRSTLNPWYTFDNFVVGPSNRLAHAAALAVSENPANSYNPLFIYGGVGLGKTHLLHAIGNAAVERDLEILYVSSEEFTNDLINAIRGHSTQAFRDKYRQPDVLLIDDIQFIAGKESTQEEFFHTFNTLHGQNKQIVISSDRSPKAMGTLEERLLSRFEWGLIADIQPPDFETRQAILRDKAESKNRHVPNHILELIAHKLQSNIRELEGALNRLLAYAELQGRNIDEELVEMALADLIPNKKDLQPEHIIKVVAEAFGVEIEQLSARGRSRKIVVPRQISMYLLREEAQLSLPQIGKMLGGRDHTTVMYACDKVSDQIEQDSRFRRQVIDIREKLFGEPEKQRVLA